MIKLKFLSAILVLAVCATAQAEIKFAIGEPAEGSTKSGIGQIAGWAVSDSEIVSVEAFIDGISVGIVPHGGTRGDVATAFPDFPNSEFSGWAMKWNYSLLSDGQHVASIVVTDIDGNQQNRDVLFSTTSFESEFISDPHSVQTSGSVATTPEDGRIVIYGAQIEGETVDIELCWDTATQQFLIDKIIYEDPSTENQAPEADAGPSLSVDPGDNVVVEGGGYDPDGIIESYSWTQVSGKTVNLVNADQKTVEFSAPLEPGTIRLRLTVTDDAGDTDGDDTIIDIIDPATEPEPEPDPEPAPGPEPDPEPAPEPEPEPDPVPEPVNQAPNANAGSNRNVETGDTVQISGSGSDNDGAITSWNWTQTSGQQVSLQNANTSSVRFTAPNSAGTIQLSLTVTDNDGATDSDNVSITVEEPAPLPNQSPSANAGSNSTVSQGDNVTVLGSGNDPDGTISDWSWDQVSGTSVSLSGANSAEVRFTAPEGPGEIRLRLTVTDNDGATDSDEVSITVEGVAEPDSTTGESMQSMLNNINDARGQDQVCGSTEYSAQPPLSWSSSLASIAVKHSMDMAREGYFSHTSIDGTSMGDRVFPYWSGTRVGENIAASSADRSDSYVVDLWMDSPGHCALIMDPRFTHVGAGAGHNSDNGYTYYHFWTLDFGG
jgi:uncharacterized protein YkwD